MIQSNFKDWTLDKIDEAFGLHQVFKMDLLDELVSFPYQIQNYEQFYIEKLQSLFLLGGDDWNEVELENKIISPMIMLAATPNEKYAYFLERNLSATIGEYELTGRVDGMFASGFRSPKKPYFCLNEYKKGTDPDGDPKGQALIAMLVAQQMNEKNQPVFGCYIIGRTWYFMILKENNYIISNDYSCVTNDVFDIFRVLKSLNHQIEILIENT
jgi:hypothetical protein